jgi:hypothetical protein
MLHSRNFFLKISETFLLFIVCPASTVKVNLVEHSLFHRYYIIHLGGFRRETQIGEKKIAKHALTL